MWNPQCSGYEARKCRYRVVHLCKGVGLDLSAGEDKIVPSAIGVGPHPAPNVNLQLDLTANHALSLFASGSMDYVFDAGRLGNYQTWTDILAEWWRIVRPGGYLILYEQDPEYYPRCGTPGAAPERRHDLDWRSVWSVLDGFGNANRLSISRHNEANEYSWQLIVRKRMGEAVPRELPERPDDRGYAIFPRQKRADKEALVIRLGALGDTLWITPVLRALKEDGYHVAVNCTEYGAQVIRECPYVDEWIILSDSKDIPYLDLEAYWKEIGGSFDRIVNLTKSIETGLLAHEGSEEYHWPHEQRHRAFNFNFQDRTMALAGYPEKTGCLPEMHFTPLEEHYAEHVRQRHRDQFMVVWGLSGSSYHKTYPFQEYVAKAFLAKHKDALIITVGDAKCQTLEWQHPQTVNKAGILTVRQSFLLTRYADLVVGPDTGLLNAASCWPTPKIIFMSANSHENLTKYWQNVTVMTPDDCPCYPCHRLVYTHDCPKGPKTGVASLCMENIDPEKVLEAMERAYEGWRKKRLAEINALKWVAFTLADDPLTHRLARRVRASFRRFHPEIPFEILHPADFLRDRAQQADVACDAFAARPIVMERLLADYDGVIYLDADTVVCDRLVEFLEGDYDVAGSLNLGDAEYLNAGVGACRSREFAQAWVDAMFESGAGPSNQVHFNNLARSGRYRLKIVDKESVYYNERSRPHWKDLAVEDGRLVCNGRRVRVLHWAGGTNKMQNKLSSSDFTDEVRQWLDTVTGTKDFTTIRGTEVSEWKLPG